MTGSVPGRTETGVAVDWIEDGSGPLVVLVHSSASSASQWDALIAALRGRFRVRAVNLYGYGRTPPWRGPGRQTLGAQASLVLAATRDGSGPVHLVGHSFGCSVAFRAAQALGDRAARLVLLEPNPFYLLPRHGRMAAYAPVLAQWRAAKRCGRAGRWDRVARRFVDYWAGRAAWDALSEPRRRALAWVMPNVAHEWDAVMLETAPVAAWRRAARRTLVAWAADTRRPIRELVWLLRAGCPGWSFLRLSGGGHMVPVTRPAEVNRAVTAFLGAAGPGRPQLP